MSEKNASPNSPETSDELVQLLNNHPQASRQLSLHWIAAVIGLIPFVMVVVLVQMGMIQVFDLPQSMDALYPIVFVVIAHSVLCLLGLFLSLGSSRALRKDTTNDAARIQQLVTYLTGRRWKMLILAWLGQGAVVMAGLYGLHFSITPWIIVPLVPSFLLISITIRQPPSTVRLASYIRRMRMLHQTSAMGKSL